MTKRMYLTSLRALLVALSLIVGGARAADGAAVIAVIGDAHLGDLDASTVEKIYIGLVSQVKDIRVTAVNATSGSPVRDRFLKTIVNKTDDDYRVKWIARRYQGLGLPPKEMPTTAEIIDFVRTTPGAIGYLDEADVPSDVKVLYKAYVTSDVKALVK